MNWWYYQRTTPRKVKGGIKAHSQRGQFGQTWWAKRWIDVLETFDIGERLNRGKSYARKGQVKSIKTYKGKVDASVQGSFYDPYKVSIKFKKLKTEEWERLTSTFFERPVIAAKLLAGQMPADIENIFEEIGLSLFPKTESDLTTDCDCPDWSNPCKHIAAVYFLLGEEFDRDPFLMFKIRGAEREEILGMAGLQTEKEIEPPRKKRGLKKRPEARVGGSPPIEPLPTSPSKFWSLGHEKQYDLGTVHPSTSAFVLKQLGNFPFWRGENSFAGTMKEMYDEASRAGLQIFAGDLGAGDKTKRTSKKI